MKYKTSTNKYTISQEPAVDINTEDDYINKLIGSFGYWQVIICLICMVTRAIPTWNVQAIFFLTPTTEFRCIKMREDVAPVNEDVQNSTCDKDCLVYEFNNNVFDSNLITEFNLICDRAWLASFTQTVFMFGMLTGILFTGWISDRYGRQITIILCGVISVTMTIASSFASNFWVFTALRLFIGIGSGGLYTITIVIITETVGSERIDFAGGIGVICDGVAQSLLAAFAYYSSTWNRFILLIGLFSCLILVGIAFIPETPRWLMANRKADRAVKLMTKIANFNKLNTENIKDNVLKCIKDIEEKQKDKVQVIFFDLFRRKELALITVKLIIVGMNSGISYFGINQYLTLLEYKNLSMSVVMTGLVQIPSTIIGMVLNKFFGRKTSLFISLVIIGLSMTVLIFIQNIVIGLVALIGSVIDS